MDQTAQAMTQALEFQISEIGPKYYADREDAFAMKRDLVKWDKQQDIDPADPRTFFPGSSGTEADKKK